MKWQSCNQPSKGPQIATFAIVAPQYASYQPISRAVQASTPAKIFAAPGRDRHPAFRE
jgi:hypothetical protein